MFRAMMVNGGRPMKRLSAAALLLLLASLSGCSALTALSEPSVQTSIAEKENSVGEFLFPLAPPEHWSPWSKALAWATVSH